MEVIKQTIKYDSERDPAFAREVMESVGCEDLANCFQCGTCSGICPLSIYMDHTPRQIMNLARSGFKEEVLTSNTIWLCSSCYACTVECPKEIKITNIMYALKQRAIHEKKYPKHFPIPVLAEEFSKMVRSYGRTSESRLVMNLFRRTQPWKILGMSKLGLGLLRTGRFSLKHEKTQQPEQIARLLDAAEAMQKEATRK